MESLIKLEDIHYSKEEGDQLNGVNLDLLAGHRLVIFPSPYGPASKLLKICATLEEPERGKLVLFGQKVDFSDEYHLYAIRRRIALVHHESAMISNLSLLENIALVLWYHENRRLGEVEKEVMEILFRFGLEKDRDRRPSTIDPFKRRRAIYAMELIKHPRIILLDRPFRDFPVYDLHYLDEVLNIAGSDPSRGILITTYNRKFIRDWANSIVILKNGTARPLQEISELEDLENKPSMGEEKWSSNST